MHRIEPPAEPASFLQYRLQNPGELNWNTFSSTHAYKDARVALYKNQGGLCAYCETTIPSVEDVDGEKLPKTSCARIEHFHAKEDHDPNHNWMLDWNNLMMVCMAGGKGNERQCDARKEDVQNGDLRVAGIPLDGISLNGKKKHYVFEGYILNPYNMPNKCLFRFDPAEGRIYPDDTVCSRVAVHGNKHATTAILVDRTIKVLGLNSSALCRQRKSVNREYENRRAALRQSATKSLNALIAREWFGSHRVMQFFTTRRCLLQGKAEPYIDAN